MPTLTFDTYYRYADLTAILQDLAARFPQLCNLTSIGKSYEGRDIWLATMTNTATGPDTNKPAFWVDANIHATEVSPSSCALYTISKVLKGYGSDKQITALLDTRALYIVPRMNPDGAELFLDERHRAVRSSTRPYPRLDKQDGLHEEDVDKDGRILTMRIKDPNGAWKAHPDDARLMIPRDPLEANGDGVFYRLLPEGVIQNYDGVGIKLAPRVEGLDLNRNFPVEWAFESEQYGAGPYPTSEPEVRAVVQFIADHQNICGGISFHTYSGVYLRPYGTHGDDHFTANDLWTFEEIGKHAKRITGYPAVSVFNDFKYHPTQTIKGVFDDWMYDHLGVYAWTCELWSPQAQAGIDLTKSPDGGKSRFIEWYRNHPVEEDLQLLKWNDDKLDGKGFVIWYPFNHPQLGEVELGGWHDEYCWRNPPPHLLEKEIAPHADFIIWHALISPLLSFRDVTVQPVGEGVYHVRAVIENTGWLPTSVSARATEKQFVRSLEIEISLPDGATLVSGDKRVAPGQLAGRALKNTAYWDADPTDDRAKVEWVVRAPQGGEVTITAAHQRAGKISRSVTLGA